MIPVTADSTQAYDSTSKRNKTKSECDSVRLHKAQSFDRNTLGGIYDEYHPQLYGYIYRRVGDVEIARDLTADVFRRFLQAAANGNGPSENLRAWLYSVAHNIVIDHYRRRQKMPGHPLEESLLVADDDPGQAAERRQQNEKVRAAIGRLTPDQQQIIGLKFLEGLSNQEVATISGKTVGAVKALQHRALASLRRYLVSSEQEVSL